MIQLTLTEILEKFQNGEHRYDKDAYFKEAITAIHLGVGIYAVLDRVLKEHLILMNLHNEAVNKNRVAVGECARLTDEAESYKEANKIIACGNSGLLDMLQASRDEVASLTEALQHHIK